ncbi:Triosephosphate isomerase [Campylobacter majalis]|uniref:Triosephosphate isomerase n=1 Tax=Campylobacter majalis TaxID=2790656 RepID=A0ABM8Q993_9BACT|nr:triose-phosphate isomerase [Campylobacter majalis]CAD7289397.1 Triosephosphate isomerase [Campylobacter majalis]
MKFYANLKCNHTRASFAKYAKILNDKIDANSDVCVFVPASAFLDNEFKFSIGGQNFYPCENGAFTGEIGKMHLDEFGIKHVLIGHSERREILNESDELLRLKFDFAVKNGWNITYCIGENLATYQDGKTKDFLRNQLSLIDLNYQNLAIAYEPIWAIGTGKSASVDDISQVLDFIRTLTHAPLLYGGSVNDKNIAEIANIKECGGVLVGGASLDAENFLNLIENARF